MKYTIAEIKQLKVGTVDIEVSGIIDRVWKARTISGTAKKSGKPYSFRSQGFLLRDDTGTLLINMTDRTLDPTTDVNKAITVTKGMYGTYESEKDGKTYTNSKLELQKGFELFDDADEKKEEEVAPPDEADKAPTVDEIQLDAVAEKGKEIFSSEDEEDKASVFIQYILEAMTEFHPVVTDENFQKMWRAGAGIMTADKYGTFILNVAINKSKASN